MAKTAKHREAEAALPPDLRDSFNVLVQEYKDSCKVHVKGGREFVNYNILAHLVRNGWRKVQG